MNPFEKHGIKHLSASSLNMYAEQPAFWSLKYLLGFKEEGNAKMWCGSAVEAGLDLWLLVLKSVNQKYYVWQQRRGYATHRMTCTELCHNNILVIPSFQCVHFNGVVSSAKLDMYSL